MEDYEKLTQYKEQINEFFMKGKHFNTDMLNWVEGPDGKLPRGVSMLDPVSPDTTFIRLYIYTEKHYYGIRVKPNGYIECSAGNRAPLPGESHTRGCDLTDGDMSDKNILTKIVVDILSEELLKTELTKRLERISSA